MTGVRVRTAEAALVFLRLGAKAFGGLGPTVALLQHELVERRGWFTRSDIRDALAFTKPLPGSTVVQVVAFLGWRLGGWTGGTIAATAFLTPSAGVMLVTAAVLEAAPMSAWLHGALTGIQVAVVGLLASALWRLWRSEAGTPVLTTVLVLACSAGFVINSAIVVGLAGLGGVLAHLVGARRASTRR